jgi:hypothetical protein
MSSSSTSTWDRDAALTTARILLEIEAIKFRPEEPYTFTSGWKSPVYIDCRRIIYFPRARAKICDLAVEKIGRNVGYAPATSRSPTSPCSAGPGATRGTRSTSPTSPTSNAGTRR